MLQQKTFFDYTKALSGEDYMGELLSMAKVFYGMGVYVGVQFEMAVMEEGWHVVFKKKTGELSPLLDVRSKQPRLFKTLDAAHKITREIGFASRILETR